MKLSVIKGFSFGLTSGIITTLGLMVGLNSSTHSPSVVIGGILVIAVSDSLSDALGIHISEEAENEHSTLEIWESMISTFVSKLVSALLFIIPVLLFSLHDAVIFSVIFGLLVIAAFSFYMAKRQGGDVLKTVVEHLFIAILVVVATHYIGNFVNERFISTMVVN